MTEAEILLAVRERLQAVLVRHHAELPVEYLRRLKGAIKLLAGHSQPSRRE